VVVVVGLGVALAGAALAVGLLANVFEDKYPMSWRLPGAIASAVMGTAMAIVVWRGPEAFERSNGPRGRTYAARTLTAVSALVGFGIAQEPGALWGMVIVSIALLLAATKRSSSSASGTHG
jgi:predicted membrane-bound dolichyl-phosphate-mannose-protein mannosyltransferase